MKKVLALLVTLFLFIGFNPVVVHPRSPVVPAPAQYADKLAGLTLNSF